MSACTKIPVSPTRLHQAPGWTRQAVWYQIFPERFHNGDPGNDPTLADIIGSWPHDYVSPYQVSSWTGDWFAYQEWESSDLDLNLHFQRRRYGGDLQGIIDKLDYLQNLGVNALYFNPLFESPSLHKYDGSTYHHIDGNFGPNPQGDREIIQGEVPDDPATWKWTAADLLFLELISECHKRGIKIIIDGVFNHVGLNFWAFRDVKAKQGQSSYTPWFTIKSWDDPDTPEDEFDYLGWFGVKELPELREDENGPAPQARAYIFNSVERWMDPNSDGNPEDGIDGWRLDVAELVSKNFWRDFREFVRGINPETYLVGEVWWEDWENNQMFNARPWLEGDIFDAVMNYRWTAETIHFFVDDKNEISVSTFARRLAGLRNDYHEDVNYVLLNLLGSHDTDRIGSQIINRDDDYDHRDNPRDNPNYSVRKPGAQEVEIQKLIVLFQMTYLGAPMIYYGDEAGMWGGDDPNCRKPMLWPEFEYEPEAFHPLGKQRGVDEVRFNYDLFNHYKKLITIRKNHSALQTGKFRILLTSNEKKVLIFKRFDENEAVIVVINNSNVSQKISISSNELGTNNRWFDILTQRAFPVDGGALSLEILAKSGAILIESNAVNSN